MANWAIAIEDLAKYSMDVENKINKDDINKKTIENKDKIQNNDKFSQLHNNIIQDLKIVEGMNKEDIDIN